MSRLDKLLNQINRWWLDSTHVKAQVGDSTNNNRVPSVRQVIRFLRSKEDILAARDLRVTYRYLLSKGLFAKLRKNCNRTDAYDMNEFHKVVNKYVKKNTGLASEVSKNIQWH